MRTKTFWEETLAAATEKAFQLHETKIRVTREIVRAEYSLKRYKKTRGKSHVREFYRNRLQHFRAEHERLRREILKLLTKVNYCNERLSVDTKTIWERLNRDSLRL